MKRYRAYCSIVMIMVLVLAASCGKKEKGSDAAEGGSMAWADGSREEADAEDSWAGGGREEADAEDSWAGGSREEADAEDSWAGGGREEADAEGSWAGGGRENRGAGEKEDVEEKDGRASGENTPTDEEYTSGSGADRAAARGDGERQDAGTGALAVAGTKLVDGSGNPVQLKGISTHGLAWYPDYVNQECIRELKEEWGMNVLRLAMYTGEYGGYCAGGDQEKLKALVKSGVDYASDCGMYVIIDWHILSDGNPNTYLEEAMEFFGEMSETYADYSNVLYEICNEPNGGTSWSDIKSYAEQVIAVIRGNDEDGIVLVGTPNWCQYVDQAAADPIEGYDNIMYTLHFYAATHKEELREAMTGALEAGLPVFVSEYGICDAGGSGGIDEYQANRWVEVMNEHQISYVAWNLSNKGETSAVLKSSCGKTSGFSEEDLSDSGKWLREMLASDAGEARDPGGGEGDGRPEDLKDKEEGGGAEDLKDKEEDGGAGEPGDKEEGDAGSSGNEGNGGAGDAGGRENGDIPAAGEAVVLQAVNSWGQGQETFYQYSLVISNLTDEDFGEWKVLVEFDRDISLNNGWNGRYQAEGNVLVISSMDYNGSIGKGSSMEGIGFIIQSGEGMAVLSATLSE